MARTRSEIQALVVLNTGRSDKDSLMDSLCDTALKMAVLKAQATQHAFKDALSEKMYPITTGQVSVSIEEPNRWNNITTARIIDSSSEKAASLKMKNKVWWDKYVINAEDSQQGWPDYGTRWGTQLLFERPVEANKTLVLRGSTIPVFASDSTECPISSIDIFVEYFVTAYIFKSLRQDDMFQRWIVDAGIALASAIESDTDSAEVLEFTKAGDIQMEKGIVTINNGVRTTWF